MSGKEHARMGIHKELGVRKNLVYLRDKENCELEPRARGGGVRLWGRGLVKASSMRFFPDTVE